MAIKIYRPTSAGRRNMSASTFDEITRREPERSLLAPITKKAGRNNQGVVTTRHRGGGHKRRYRIIDFRRDNHGVSGRIETIEYDPNRSARIALVVYDNGERRYILAAEGLKVNDTVVSGPQADIRVGNALPIRNIERTLVSRIHHAKRQLCLALSAIPMLFLAARSTF